MDVEQNILQLYRQWAGSDPVSVTALPGAGSNRKYYRFTDKDGATVVGVVGTSRDEDDAFISLSNHFD